MLSGVHIIMAKCTLFSMYLNILHKIPACIRDTLPHMQELAVDNNTGVDLYCRCRGGDLSSSGQTEANRTL